MSDDTDESRRLKDHKRVHPQNTSGENAVVILYLADVPLNKFQGHYLACPEKNQKEFQKRKNGFLL